MLVVLGFTKKPCRVPLDQCAYRLRVVSAVVPNECPHSALDRLVAVTSVNEAFYPMFDVCRRWPATADNFKLDNESCRTVEYPLNVGTSDYLRATIGLQIIPLTFSDEHAIEWLRTILMGKSQKCCEAFCQCRLVPVRKGRPNA